MATQVTPRNSFFDSAAWYVLHKVILLAALCLFYFSFGAENLGSTTRLITFALPFLLFALAEAPIMSTGNVDFSVVSIGVFSPKLISDLSEIYGYSDAEWYYMLGATLLVAVCCAGLNIILTRISALPITIVTAFTGIGLYAASRALHPFNGIGLNPEFKLSQLNDILPVALIILVLIFLSAFLATKLRAIGSNPKAAEESGINNIRVKSYSLILASLFGGLSGFLFLSDVEGLGIVGIIIMYLLVFAMCIIGGGSIFGGKKDLLGLFFSVPFLLFSIGFAGRYLSKIMPENNAGDITVLAFPVIIILACLTVDLFRHRKR